MSSPTTPNKSDSLESDGDPKARVEQAKKNRVNAFFGLLEYAAQAISLVFITPLFLHYLGDAAYGLFIIGLTIMGLNGLFSMGIGPATQHYIAKYRDQSDQSSILRLIETSIVASLLLGVIAMVAILVLAQFALPLFVDADLADSKQLMATVCISAIAMPLVFLSNSLDNSLRGFEAFHLAVPIMAITQLAIAIIQILMIILGYDVVTIIASQVIFIATRCLLCWVIIKLKLVPQLGFIPGFSMDEFKNFANFGGFVWLTSVLTTLRTSGEVLMLVAILGPAPLALYAIPAKVLGQVHQLLSKAFGFLFPFATKLVARGDRHQLKFVYERSTQYLTVLSALAIIPLATASSQLIGLWLGAEKSAQITPIFVVLSFRFIVFPLSILTRFLLLASEKTGIMTVVVAVNVALILPVSGILAWQYGVMGAAYAQLLVFCPIVFNRYYIEKSLFGTPKFSTVVGPIASLATLLLISLLIVDGSLERNVIYVAVSAMAAGLLCGGILWILHRPSSELEFAGGTIQHSANTP